MGLPQGMSDLILLLIHVCIIYLWTWCHRPRCCCAGIILVVIVASWLPHHHLTVTLAMQVASLSLAIQVMYVEEMEGLVCGIRPQPIQTYSDSPRGLSVPTGTVEDADGPTT